MSADPHPNQPGQPTEDDALFRDYLLALLDTGAAIVQSIKRQAEREAPTSDTQPTPNTQPPNTQPPDPTPDLADRFERVARAMRRTILLARHIAQPRAYAPARTAARKRIIREVEDAIQREPGDPQPLRAELLDRLDSPDLEDEIASRPIPDIILDICRDFGLENMYGNHPWERRTPRDIATLRARAAAPNPPGYIPAPHGPDLGGPDPRGPDNPNRRDHPPDPATEMREMLALARRLSGT